MSLELLVAHQTYGQSDKEQQALNPLGASRKCKATRYSQRAFLVIWSGWKSLVDETWPLGVLAVWWWWPRCWYGGSCIPRRGESIAWEITCLLFPSASTVSCLSHHPSVRAGVASWTVQGEGDITRLGGWKPLSCR